jgi:hypothetical protein
MNIRDALEILKENAEFQSQITEDDDSDDTSDTSEDNDDTDDGELSENAFENFKRWGKKV